jgi:hypothetical protein
MIASRLPDLSTARLVAIWSFTALASLLVLLRAAVVLYRCLGFFKSHQ